MSNRRRPQRRDSHGAPVRSTREKAQAALVALGVVAVTTVAVVVLHHRDPAPPTVPVDTSTSSPAASTPSSAPDATTPEPSDSAPATDATTPTSDATTTSSAP